MERLEPYLDLNVEDRPGEEWRPITGYAGRYVVSNQGRVKSCPTLKAFMGTDYLTKVIIRKQTFRVHKNKPTKTNEYTISLYDGCKHKTHSVSALVADAFIRLREKGELVLRKNRQPHDNRVSNLWIGTSVDLYESNKEAGLRLVPHHTKYILKQLGTWVEGKLVSVTCNKCHQTKPADQFQLSQNQYTCQTCRNSLAQERKKRKAIKVESLSQTAL